MPNGYEHRTPAYLVRRAYAGATTPAEVAHYGTHLYLATRPDADERKRGEIWLAVEYVLHELETHGCLRPAVVPVGDLSSRSVASFAEGGLIKPFPTAAQTVGTTGHQMIARPADDDTQPIKKVTD